MVRTFFLIVLAVFIEHLVNQIRDPRLTLAVVLIGGAILLRTLLRRSRQQGVQAATAAEPAAPGPGNRARPGTAAAAGVRPTRSEPPSATQRRRWR